MQLYGHPFSSFTWKALIPFYALKLPFDFRVVQPDNPENSAFVAAASPLGKFPVLTDGQRTVFEATAIIEYLAAVCPQAQHLIPRDPIAAMEMRMLDRVFDLSMQIPMTAVVLAHIRHPEQPDADVITTARSDLRRCYLWLERYLEEKPVGTDITLATCAAAPALFYADWIEPIPDEAPLLQNLRAELLALPAVRRCVDDARPYRSWFPPGAPDRD